MSIVRGCEIPEQLYYDVAHAVWVRLDKDGACTVGYAAPGCVGLGEIRSYSPKRVGKVVRKGMSCATLESEYSVEPARSPIAGVVIAVNERALHEPLVINRDPYGSGWLARIQPENWLRDKEGLLTGQEALDAFEVALAARALSRSDAVDMMYDPALR